MNSEDQNKPAEKLLSLDVIEQVQITRSFSRKVQLNQYEPMDCFCSVQTVLKAGVSEDDISKVSRELDAMAKKEVDRSIENYYTAHKPPF